MNDAKEYSVTIADTTKTFTATDNKIVAVAVNPVTVPYATLTTISAVATDAQGIVLDEVNYNNQVNVTIGGKTAEFTITPAAGGYTDGAQLYLAKKGDTAKAKVTIKSGEYDATGKELNNIESGEVTITAGDQEVVTVSGFKARVTTDAKATKYDEAKDNSTVAVSDPAKVFLKFTNSKDKELSAAEYAKYKVSSSNTNVLLMDETEATTSAISVIGVAAGSAYLIVKDDKSNVVATLPVTISAKRAVDALTLSKTNFTLSTASGVNTETVKVVVKDQYKETLASSAYALANANVEVLTTPSGATSKPSATVSNKDTITFSASGVTKEGAYTYKVTVTDATDPKITRSQIVTVNVKAPTGTVGYTFEITGLDADNTVDATLNDKTTTDGKNVTIKVVKTLGGVKESYATFSAINVKKDNKDVTITSNAAAGTATFAAIETNASDIVTGAAAGTYVVSATTADGAKVAPVTFIVKNDTAKIGVAQDKTELKASVATSDKKKVAEKAFKYTFGSTELKFGDGGNATIEDATATGSCGTPGHNLFVQKVTIQVKLSASVKTTLTVDVNKSVKTIAD